MNKIAAQIITISSQLLVASVFLFLLFSGENTNNKSVVVDNNNFNKMADKTLFLFKSLDETKKEEEDSNVIVELTSVDEKEELSENVKDEDNNLEVNKEEVKEETIEKEESNVIPLTPDFIDRVAIETFTGNLTGYGPNCVGCSGKTSTGYDLTQNIYYEDAEFGIVRIVAADKYFPFYSIIRISGVPGMDSFLAIVLDRGGNVGFDKGTLFDLAFSTEKDPNILGLTRNVKFEVLRSGN